MRVPGRRDFFTAAWWTAALRVRPLVPAAWAGAGLVLGGCAETWGETQPEHMQSALDQQQHDGWSVGDEGQPLVFPGAQATDITGGDRWREALGTLALRLAPGASWAPYYNPTLFQSLEALRSADLRMIVRPVFTPEMALASRRGAALLSLLIEDGVCRNDVALVLDLPGPEAVAVAAALAPCLDPVFVLANWPHPAGVVPAHLTLGAALYFLPSFERDRAGRPQTAAPVFVLDRGRLAPYTDDANQFDNRYLAGLPPREALQAAGIRHLLYVTPDDLVTREADDLNDDLVAIAQGDIDVKLLSLSDFSERPLPEWPEPPPCLPIPSLAGPAPQLYFGGSPGAHSCFSFWYGWRLPPPSTTGSWISIPPRLAPRCRFHPAARATFPAASHGSFQPGGGWHATGGWRGGFGRSGSLGRGHFGGFG